MIENEKIEVKKTDNGIEIIQTYIMAGMEKKDIYNCWIEEENVMIELTQFSDGKKYKPLFPSNPKIFVIKAIYEHLFTE